jgi:hypothetical protein
MVIFRALAADFFQAVFLAEPAPTPKLLSVAAIILSCYNQPRKYPVPVLAGIPSLMTVSFMAFKNRVKAVK